MLFKIIKHELKNTYKFNAILTIVFIAVVIIARLSIIPYIVNSGRNLGMLYLAFMIIMLIVLFACLAVYNLAPAVYSVIRFYKTAATNEGYLTFMLPVSADTIILGKLIAASLWQILSGIISILSAFYFIFSLGIFDPYLIGFDLYSAVTAIYNYSPLNMILFFLTLILSSLVTTASGFLKAYASISLGQCFDRNKIIASIAVYFGLSLIYSLISSAVGISYTVNMNLLNSPAELVFRILNSIMTPILLGVLFELCFLIAYYFITRYFLKNKLNLS